MGSALMEFRIERKSPSVLHVKGQLVPTTVLKKSTRAWNSTGPKLNDQKSGNNLRLFLDHGLLFHNHLMKRLTAHA
jgi:hypothetical protein